VKRNELTILLGLVVVGLVIGFWLLVISPKRSESASLKGDIDQLNSELSQAQQAVTAGQEAKKSFPIDYRRLVVLGKAVPADGEQASLLFELQRLADGARVRFQSLDLSDASTSGTAPSTETAAVASTESPSTTSSSPSSSSSSSASTSSSTSTPPAAPAAATETSAASLPIGASVGPAGLPVMPYELKFTGDYFQIADFLKRLDSLVHTSGGVADVHGRLVTVDAFSLEPVQSDAGGASSPIPQLTADLTVTTYLTPADQGTTVGATPSGPAAATPTPAATTATSSTSTPTASSSSAAGTATATSTSP